MLLLRCIPLQLNINGNKSVLFSNVKIKKKEVVCFLLHVSCYKMLQLYMGEKNQQDNYQSENKLQG